MKKGFTLVELSIVLVIIGLIVAGVVMGRDLVRNFQLRNIISDYEEYVAAINAFKLKYDGLPGDLANASIYFAPLSSGTCLATSTTDKTTCPGDGDNIIEYGSASGTMGAVREAFRFWEHLGLAGLYGGAYSGIPGAVNAFDHDVGINSPATAVDGATFGVMHVENAGVGPQTFFGNSDNIHLFMVGFADGANTLPNGNFITPQEAFSVDSKVDDGAPGKGKVQSRVNAACVTQTSDAQKTTSEYELSTDSTLACTLIFNLGTLQF